MPGVRSNTIYECTQCHSKFDFEDITLAENPCEFCGSRSYSQIVVVVVCDFCSTPSDESELWTYQCRDFQYGIHAAGIPEGGSKGDWAACDECHRLIEAEDRNGLASRTVEHDLQREPQYKGHEHFLFAIARKIHSGFFAHRYGSPWKEGSK